MLDRGCNRILFVVSGDDDAKKRKWGNARSKSYIGRHYGGFFVQ